MTKKEINELKHDLRKAREVRDKFKDALLDMLQQHGYNWALSANENACALLGHPAVPDWETRGEFKGMVGGCYCRARKVKKL